jgi:ADP-ribose pyrophosphatase
LNHHRTARRLAAANSRFDVYFDSLELAGGGRVDDFLIVRPRVQDERGVGGVLVLPESGGRIGLMRGWRHHLDCEVWQAPSGFVEPGEQAEQTALRELEEETGLSCALRQLQLLGLFLPDAGLIEARVALFAARGVQPKPGVRQAEREAGTGELHWFSREALQRLAQSAGDIGGSTLVACLRWLLAPAAARGDNAHP